jgi:hypothetical protein
VRPLMRLTVHKWLSRAICNQFRPLESHHLAFSCISSEGGYRPCTEDVPRADHGLGGITPSGALLSPRWMEFAASCASPLEPVKHAEQLHRSRHLQYHGGNNCSSFNPASRQ